MAEHMEVGLGVPVLSSMMCFSYSAKRENISLYQDSRIDIPSMARGLGEFVFKLETNSNFEVGDLEYLHCGIRPNPTYISLRISWAQKVAPRQ